MISNSHTVNGVRIEIMKNYAKYKVKFGSPNGIGAGETVNFKAMPYFFNIASKEDILFKWLVNNKEPQITDPLAFTSPNELALTIPKEISPQTLINVIASAKNVRIPSEVSTVLKKVTVF